MFLDIFEEHYVSTPFAVHYEKIRNHLRGTATESAKIHSLARKYEHSYINQISRNRRQTQIGGVQCGYLNLVA